MAWVTLIFVIFSQCCQMMAERTFFSGCMSTTLRHSMCGTVEKHLLTYLGFSVISSLTSSSTNDVRKHCVAAERRCTIIQPVLAGAQGDTDKQGAIQLLAGNYRW